MPNILSTDQRSIRNLDCSPEKQKRIVFEGSSLKIVMGSQVLDTVDMSSIFHPASINGGNFKKRIYISAGGTYNLYGGNIAQDQGEVSLIVVKVKYDKSLAEENKIIYWEYNGKVFPCKNLIFLTGKTLDSEKHQGWDLEPYNSDVSPAPVFSPELDPQPTSPDFLLGGIRISNPTLKEVELEILVMN
jgi:hypothetical protein